MTKTEDQKAKTNEVVAILLAAGRSSRMGTFKPLLPFGETTVIRSCISKLRDGGVQNIVVVVGHRADDVKNSLDDLSVNFALNPDLESGMSASIACAVKESPNETRAVLIALGDQPALPAKVVRAVLNEWSLGSKLVKPTFEGRGGHPVLIDLQFRSELINLGPGGLRAFFEGNRDQLRTIAVDSPLIARDIDTWDDYRELHKEIFGRLPVPSS